MKFIDTHCHLYSSKFNVDRTDVINNALDIGVENMLLPNISSKYTNRMLDLCNEFPNTCFPMMGLHPCDVKEETYMNEIKHVEQELEKNIYIAVGEIGLDLYWDTSTLKLQKEAFIHQIKLAKKYNLPIVIHVRESFKEAIKIVEDLNDNTLRGVFHCFTGGIAEGNRILELENFYLGIGGVLTFKNSLLDETIKNIDLKYLLLETDAPYLSPMPNRGKRNESKFLLDIAKKLSEVKDIPLEEIAKKTTENAKKLFQL